MEVVYYLTSIIHYWKIKSIHSKLSTISQIKPQKNCGLLPP